MKIIPISSFILFIFYFSFEYAKANNCGYNSCDPGKPNILNVHIISHTHDDVGWLKTVDQYYYGYKDNIQSAGVQYILDTVISALWENPSRKFSYVEIAYFYRWWQQQDQKVKSRVQILVREGRLQFLLGGWCMNDEATTHYTAIIDQMSLGLDFLNKTFGECGRPLVSWQIDPFGHSIEQANIFANMGFDALFFMRLDYRDKDQRLASKRMEFLQSGSFLASANINRLFTNILYDSYCTPGGFCFDDKCSDDPMMDDPTLHDDNVKQRVEDFANYVLKQAKYYQSNHILVPMGCDFQFQNAYHNFVNLDKLIFHVNRLRKDINVIYSTPACYTLAVNRANKSYTIKNDDFFPYASGANSFWTGYFTSRASLKGFVRKSNNLFQICKQLHVISQINKLELNQQVYFMATKMGVLQHHDAISGTEKQQVAFDYEQRLDNGVQNCEKVINQSLSSIISKENLNYDFVLCGLTNISYCSVTDNILYNKPMNILLYNPLGQSHSTWNSIPVQIRSGDKYLLKQSNGNNIVYQSIPISERTKSIPERPKNSNANFDLVFEIVVPAMGYTSFTIERLKNTLRKEKLISKDLSLKDNIIVENEFIKLTYNKGLLTNIFNIKSKINMKLSIDIRYYNSYQEGGQKSGAYIFRPTTNESIAISTTPIMNVIKGPLLTEIHQNFSNWGTLVTKLYHNSKILEMEWTVGPIPVKDKQGKEIVIQYQTDLNTENNFYTDSNGRQTITRQINKRYDYKFNQTEPVSGNFYPVNSHVFLIDIKNGGKGIIIHVDRSQGVGAYRKGMVEIMVHRRTLYDDNFGVGEPLNEIGSDGDGLIVRGRHWISFGFLDTLLSDIRLENLKIFNKPIMMFSKQYNQSKISDYSALISELPRGINLMTLENHFNLKNEIDYQIIRLENVLDMPGKTLNIDFNKVFKYLSINYVEELSLSANQFLKDVKRLKWNEVKSHNQDWHVMKNLVISLSPGQIRTFKVKIKAV